MNFGEKTTGVEGDPSETVTQKIYKPIRVKSLSKVK